MKRWQSRLSEIYAPRTAAAPPGPVGPAAAAPRTGTPAVRLLGRRSVGVAALEVAADGHTIVAAYADAQLQLVRAGSGLPLHDWSLPGQVHSLALSADGLWMAIGLTHVPQTPAPAAGMPARSAVRIYNLRHGTLEQTLTIDAPRVQVLSFHPAGRLLAVAAGSRLELWEPWSGHPKQVLRGHEHAITCVAFGPDGAALASGDAGGSLHVWHTSGGPAARSLHQQGELSSLTISGDGAWVAWGTRDGSVLVSSWSGQRLDRVRQIEGHGLPVAALRFSTDHQWLVIGKGTGLHAASRGDTAVGVVRLWSTTQGRLQAEHGMGDVPLSCLATSPDGRWLAVGSPRGEVRVVACQDGSTLRTFSRRQVGVTSLALSHDRQWLVSGREDGQVSVWQARGGTLQRQMPVHRTPVIALGFSADGRWWASGATDGTVLLWGRGKATPLRLRPGLRHMSFCPDGHWLALAGQSGAIDLLPLRDPVPQEARHVHQARAGIVGLQFSAHGHVLAWICEQGIATCWDPASGQVRSSHKLPAQGLRGCTFSDDLRWLAACAHDGSLLLWDMNLGRLAWRQTLSGTDGAQHLMFSPDATRLHTCGADASLSEWSVETGALLQRGPAAPAHYACLGLVQPQADQPLCTEALADHSICLM